MASIVEELTIEASPRRVWEAITQQDEIVHWWAYEARVKPEVGSLGEFRFRPPAGVLQFEVAELDQDKKVSWISRQGPPQWAGTNVTWQLEPVQNGTKLVFTHEGFAQFDKVNDQTRGNWQYFLTSLKSYLETGKGTPGLPPSVTRSNETQGENTMTTLNQSARQLNVAIEWQGFSRDELQSITAPVIIATGDHRIVPVELSLEMSRLIPNAQLAVISNAGHFVLNVDPEKLLPTVVAFLDEPISTVPFATPRTGYHPGVTR